MVGLAGIGVLEGYRQHLIGLEGQLQRYVAERLVYGIFARGQQAGVGHLLIVGAAREHLAQDGSHAVDVADVAVGVHHLVVEAVGGVVGHALTGRGPQGVADARGLAQVGEGDDVARTVVAAGLVGHPQLHTGDDHARHDGGQLGHVAVVGVAEVVGKEEVAVLVVVGHVDLKLGELAAALGAHGGRLGGLLRHHGLQRELTKLQVGTDTEERGGARDER